MYYICLQHIFIASTNENANNKSKPPMDLQQSVFRENKCSDLVFEYVAPLGNMHYSSLTNM